MQLMNQIEEAKQFIQRKLNKQEPTIGLILGSGLGVLADYIEEPTTIPYEQIPHFPKSTVAGHKGQLVIGELEGQSVLAMQGRFHYYEGYPMEAVTFPVLVMNALGIDQLIVTNAAGGINENFEPGDLMIIQDHINMMGTNPLIGPNPDELAPRYPDMSQAYNKTLRNIAEETANELGHTIRKGVYVGNSGPTYETSSEIKMLRILGGDAVGMSTVPEVIVANHSGMSVLGISCISNMAAGILDQPLSHEEVIETTERVRADFIQIVRSILTKM